MSVARSRVQWEPAATRARVRRLLHRVQVGLKIVQRRLRGARRAAQAWWEAREWRDRPESSVPLPAPRATAGATILALAAIGVGAGIVMRTDRILGSLPAARSDCPSRVYARPIRLGVGQTFDPGAFTTVLGELGYRPAEERLDRGTFRLAGDRLAVMLRPLAVPMPGAPQPVARRLDLRVEHGRIAALLIDGERTPGPVPVALPLLARLYSERLVDCRPLDPTALSAHVPLAILAAEDDRFYEHSGISTAGILRALWVNVTRGAVRQGGSTVTQQLIKNLYLTPARTLPRKALEAFLALALESRHGKGEILASYMNHAYWGRRGAIQLVGIGAAAGAWFGKDAAELDLAEAALLAAMLRSPGSYDPTAHPARALRRRNWVLERMDALGWISPEQHAAARAREVVTSTRPPDPGRAPYFVQWVAGELRRDLGLELRGGGYDVLTTLRYEDQLVAEAVLADGLSRLDRREARLQGALVSIDPATGDVLAYVGGRDFASSQFDRARHARRQLGSAFKPLVYAAALESGVIDPDDVVYDAPLLVAYGQEYWMPHNADSGFSGPVSARHALEHSLNVPAVRVAIAAGLDRVRDLAARARLMAPAAEAVPSLALGTAQAAPLEVGRAYAALAADGRMVQAHGLVAVYAGGSRVHGFAQEDPVAVVEPAVARRLTGMLQGVLQRGTAAAVRSYGLRDPVAGKTGTSDERRDAWFAGYAPERATVVWVGRDDAASTGYYGAQAALPIWARFMRAVRPEGGYGDWSVPPAAAAAGPGVDRGPAPELDAELVESILRPQRQEWQPRALPARRGYVIRRQYRDGRYVDVAVRVSSPRVAGRSWLEGPPRGRDAEDREDPWAWFLGRLESWRDRSVSTGPVRVYEVPTWLTLPCAPPGRAAVEGDPCAAARTSG